MRKLIVILSLFLMTFTQINFVNAQKSDDQATLKAGDKCPNFELQDVNGKRVTLADLKNNYIYIDLWATW